MVNYDDLKTLYKQFSDLCKTEGTERYPKILLDIFGSYNCNILTNIPDYYLDYNITLGDYIYDQAGHSCLDIFYPLNDFFDDIIDDSSKNNKTYDLSTLQLTLSCCISEFMSTCDELMISYHIYFVVILQTQKYLKFHSVQFNLEMQF